MEPPVVYTSLAPMAASSRPTDFSQLHAKMIKSENLSPTYSHKEHEYLGTGSSDNSNDSQLTERDLYPHLAKERVDKKMEPHPHQSRFSSMADPRHILDNAIAAVKTDFATSHSSPSTARSHLNYATSILKGKTWTVQSQQAQSQSSALRTGGVQKVKIIPRSFVPHSLATTVTSSSDLHQLAPVRTVLTSSGADTATTQYGITASLSRPGHSNSVNSTDSSRSSPSYTTDSYYSAAHDPQSLSLFVKQEPPMTPQYHQLHPRNHPSQSHAASQFLGGYEQYNNSKSSSPAVIHAKLEEEEDWLNKVDVSKFAEDISKDLMKSNKRKRTTHAPTVSTHQKPGWSYSSLIGLALKNSDEGKLTVSDIYAFVTENFPYFRTAPSGWKNSVRHNLSLNKCFKKVDIDPSEAQTVRKSCLWMINPERTDKVEQDIRKWRERNPDPAAHGLARPQDLQAIEEGTKGLPNMDRISKGYRASSYERNTKSTYGNISASSSTANTCSLYPKKEKEVVYQKDHRDELQVAIDHGHPKNTRHHRNLTLNYDALSRSSDDDRDGSLSPPLSMDNHFLPCTLEDSLTSFKRPFSQPSFSPAKGMSSDLFCPITLRSLGPSSPPRKSYAYAHDFDLSLSPLRYHGCSGGFDTANDALNDNSLMSAALCQSPYKQHKGPVTFPAF